VAVSAPVDCDPDVGLDPVQEPDAVQKVASVDDQSSTALALAATDVGFAVNVRVGGGAVTVTVTESDAEPPGPVQLKL
jgi:hypothetical protein